MSISQQQIGEGSNFNPFPPSQKKCKAEEEVQGEMDDGSITAVHTLEGRKLYLTVGQERGSSNDDDGDSSCAAFAPTARYPPPCFFDEFDDFTLLAIAYGGVEVGCEWLSLWATCVIGRS
ncbi:hypothetical protein M413DRAFT_7782 [Hebeloma cylindrosporum]|uniref:Uncharacterized protein n=1 Tax=Hebeloma cylindrosporum TaxID=76867 RepID=A0A0C2YBL3_HEBCY|nr:hypothetical protein M413DRAFT_7782 [Hebeloma cylindrosporum h7]